MFADVEILKLVLVGQYSEDEISSNILFDLVKLLK